jgi:ABC-type glycerol-3-phosphate transport system permease component
VRAHTQRIKHILLYATTTLITILVLFPVIFGFFTSFKPNPEIFVYPPRLLPQKWTLQPYTSVLTQQRYLHYFLNGYLISISSTLLCVFLGSLAGYGLSRFKLPAKRGLMLGILALQMFPGAVLMVPYFNLSRALGIYDTYIVLILIDTTFALSLVTWLLKSYFDSIPVTLEEAAMVDGCSRFRALRSIVMPLARAGFIGTGVFAFIRAWNEFMFALILTKGPNRAPVTVGLAELFGQYTIQWNGVMALTVIATFPLLIAFIFVQRYIIRGITSGAVK